MADSSSCHGCFSLNLGVQHGGSEASVFNDVGYLTGRYDCRVVFNNCALR